MVRPLHHAVDVPVVVVGEDLGARRAEEDRGEPDDELERPRVAMCASL